MATFPERLEHTSGARMEIEPDLALLGLRGDPIQRGALLDRLGDTLDSVGWSPLGGGRSRIADGPRISDGRRHLWLRADAEGADVQDARAACADRLGDRFDYVGPAYRMPESRGAVGVVCPIPNVVLVTVREGLDDDDVRRLGTLLADRFGAREDLRLSRLGLPLALRHFRVEDSGEGGAYETRAALEADHGDLVRRARLDYVTLVSPFAWTPPADPSGFYADQWNLARIEAEAAWDIDRGETPAGSADVLTAVLDDGFHLTHPDLAQNLLPGMDIGSTATAQAVQIACTPDCDAAELHGTHVAGVICARMDNATGVVGLAGLGKVYPIRFDTSGEAALAIVAAADYAGPGVVRVVNMSFGWPSLSGADETLIDEAIAYAVTKDLVLCAAAGNGPGQGHGPPTSNLYPARHAEVMACGGSNKADGRMVDPLGSYESHYGKDEHLGVTTGVSVVAPGEFLWSTHQQHANQPSQYQSDYVRVLGTSFSTPHVAALAHLLANRYGLSRSEIRRIIERTAEKVPGYVYADFPDFSGGPHNLEMGHGRIHAYHALDLGDVAIRDHPADAGIEPSQPPNGNYWCCSDIVLRPDDDGVFQPADPDQSSRVKRGQDNWLYVRIVNTGPNAARSVNVDARLVQAATGITYPEDWTLDDATHRKPVHVSTSFASIAPGGANAQIAKFRIPAAVVDQLWSWQESLGFAPTVVARVTAANDWAWAEAQNVADRTPLNANNLALRSVTVVDGQVGDTLSFILRVPNRRPAFDIRLVFAIEKLRAPVTPPWGAVFFFPGLPAPPGGNFGSGTGRPPRITQIDVVDAVKRRDGRGSVVIELTGPVPRVRLRGFGRGPLLMGLQTTVPPRGGPIAVDVWGGLRRAGGAAGDGRGGTRVIFARGRLTP